jgi:hypothetical protein
VDGRRARLEAGGQRQEASGAAGLQRRFELHCWWKLKAEWEMGILYLVI